jgi:hypothetical protein
MPSHKASLIASALVFGQWTAANGQIQYRPPFESGEDLLVGIEHHEVAERYAAAVFINATLHALKNGYVMGVSRASGGDTSKVPPWPICIPATLQMGQVIAMVANYVKRNQSSRKEDSQRVIYKAALQSYPCKD